MEIKGKKVAVVGLGVSGQSALRYALQEGAQVSAVNIGAVHSWPAHLVPLLKNIRCLAQEDEGVGQHLAGQDLILLSPGIDRQSPFLSEAISSQIPMLSEIELAAARFQGTVIAVTGTNGKSSTATMLARALELAGKRVFLGGNIGRPFVDYFLDGEAADFAVVELSSFQLEGIERFHPKVGMILNLHPSHGERYPLLEDYARAKARIARNMGESDLLLLGESKIKAFNERSWPCPVIRMPTSFQSHHSSNQWFVEETLRFLKIDLRVLKNLAEVFKGMPHRCEQLEVSGRLFKVFNDAKSTNWQATLSALRSVKNPDEPIWLICGGQRRGRHDCPDAEQIGEISRLTTRVLAIGESGEAIKKSFSSAQVFINLGEAWREILRQPESKSAVILFSPAYPSFDQYQNFVERGEHFKGLVSDI